MFRRFNDVSIRNKLIVIVSGTVAMLTTAVLLLVAISARSQVNDDVRHELEDARNSFVVGEGEHLHEHVVESQAIAGSDFVVDLVAARKSKAACAWAVDFLNGRRDPISPEDSFDLVAVVLPNGESLVAALSQGPVCSEKEMRWRFPGLSNDAHRSEVTNWESTDDRFYELVESPVIDTAGHNLGTLIVGFEVSDVLAAHIKGHTGQDAFLWHMEGSKPHLLGASDPQLRKLLATTVENGGVDSAVPLNRTGAAYSILDASIQDATDIVHNPQGLRVALVQPLDVKYLPFRRLEYSLLLLAGLTLLVGLLLGVAMSRPIARPLANLAAAAESVADGNLETAVGLMKQNPNRMDAKDEIGVLGRSFLRMVQGLKERLTMSTFLSNAAFEHIRGNAERGSASGRTSLAILFADVRKFSNFAETRDPETVVQLLNQVLSIEAETVKKHGGDVDKFVGDAVIAWFSGPDRCRRALLAANEMIANLQARFNGQPGTTIGVGIHVGDVVVGSIGSAARRDYTAIGSTVNLASRLCSNAHAGQVLVSQAVVTELGDQTQLKPLAPISMKGFSEPVPVFEANLSEAAGD
ncbi:MAG TPA: adenylate/guanylate cyclase domain-containing protein [Verrucomicrobiae bacterium]|nr:adenylate/guanylate cyclase domain-containing protein [Verrucomicrobiae bacterium]